MRWNATLLAAARMTSEWFAAAVHSIDKLTDTGWDSLTRFHTTQNWVAAERIGLKLSK